MDPFVIPQKKLRADRNYSNSSENIPVAVEGELCLILETEDTKELEDEEVQPEQLAASEAEETGEQMERNGASSSATAGTDGGNPDSGVDLTGDLSHGPAEKPRQPQLKSYPRHSFGSQAASIQGFFVLPVITFSQCAWNWWSLRKVLHLGRV